MQRKQARWYFVSSSFLLFTFRIFEPFITFSPSTPENSLLTPSVPLGRRGLPSLSSLFDHTFLHLSKKEKRSKKEKGYRRYGEKVDKKMQNKYTEKVDRDFRRLYRWGKRKCTPSDVCIFLIDIISFSCMMLYT